MVIHQTQHKKELSIAIANLHRGRGGAEGGGAEGGGGDGGGGGGGVEKNAEVKCSYSYTQS